MVVMVVVVVANITLMPTMTSIMLLIVRGEVHSYKRGITYLVVCGRMTTMIMCCNNSESYMLMTEFMYCDLSSCLYTINITGLGHPVISPRSVWV